MVSTLKKFMKFVGASVVAASLYSVDVAAQDGDAPEASRRDTYQDWVLVCFPTDAGEACSLQQAFVQQDTGRPILRAIVRRLPNAENAIMIVTVPLGVDLRKGAALQVAEEQFINGLTYTMCLQDGCRLQFQLTQESLDAMRTADQGRLIFGRPNQQQNIGVPVSFSGFAEAYAAFLGTQ